MPLSQNCPETTVVTRIRSEAWQPRRGPRWIRREPAQAGRCWELSFVDRAFHGLDEHVAHRGDFVAPETSPSDLEPRISTHAAFDRRSRRRRTKVYNRGCLMAVPASLGRTGGVCRISSYSSAWSGTESRCRRSSRATDSGDAQAGRFTQHRGCTPPACARPLIPGAQTRTS